MQSCLPEAGVWGKEGAVGQREKIRANHTADIGLLLEYMRNSPNSTVKK